MHGFGQEYFSEQIKFFDFDTSQINSSDISNFTFDVLIFFGPLFDQSVRRSWIFLVALKLCMYKALLKVSVS